MKYSAIILAGPLIGLSLIALPVSASAQGHDPAAHQENSPERSAAEPETEDAQGEQDADNQPMDHSKMDHSQMDHSQMDHSQMGHGQMDRGAHSGRMAIPEGPPPPEALQGPTFAADAFIGTEKMAAARAAVTKSVSGPSLFWLQGDRFEYRQRSGGDGYLWDVQGYYGGDYDKFWFKTEGEGTFGEPIESAEVQALWSRAIGPFFDLQGGIRHDFAGPERTYGVIGVQGLAPYQFEIDAAAFVSNKGDATARIEAELDQRITQRLILQPRAELSVSAQDIPELGIGAGIDRIEAGLRLRYELAREFAPYVGVAQEWKLGGSRDFARAEGEDPSVTNVVIGVRFWF